MCNAAPARAASPRGMADCPEIKGLVGRACSPAPAEAEATATATATAGYPWDGGAVWVGRTRRKPVPGGSMAPSMAPTVLPTHTAPPLTDSCGCWWVPTVGRHICQISNELIRADQRSAPTKAVRRSGRSRKSVEGGWVRLRGREPHGCGDRAYMDVLAASPSIGPTPPSHGKPAFEFDVAVAVAVA